MFNNSCCIAVLNAHRPIHALSTHANLDSSIQCNVLAYYGHLLSIVTSTLLLTCIGTRGTSATCWHELFDIYALQCYCCYYLYVTTS